jgi:hypothetical protein
MREPQGDANGWLGLDAVAETEEAVNGPRGRLADVSLTPNLSGENKKLHECKVCEWH